MKGGSRGDCIAHLSCHNQGHSEAIGHRLRRFWPASSFPGFAGQQKGKLNLLAWLHDVYITNIAEPWLSGVEPWQELAGVTVDPVCIVGEFLGKRMECYIYTGYIALKTPRR
jgi:hypothetical protein